MSQKKFYCVSICFLSLIIWQITALAQESLKFPLKFNSKDENKVLRSLDLIHFGDLIEVDVIGSNEFDWRGTLTPEGYLNGLDFVENPIYALCRSENEVAKDISKGFEKLLRDPQVNVRILDKSGRALSYLYGAVKNQQKFNIQREIKLNELIIISGGLEERASGEIQIFRSNRLNCEDLSKKEESKTLEKQEISTKNQDSQIINIKITDLIKGVKEANPVILNGDIITIGVVEPIYVIGGVNTPRQINARLQTTLSRAIASAGGIAKNGDSTNITIYRREQNETRRIEVDLTKIEKKEIEDVQLLKYDIVEVIQTGQDKKKFVPFVKVFENEKKNYELPLRIIN
jgi:protein involved in polysaccharide export with SLBB domain